METTGFDDTSLGDTTRLNIWGDIVLATENPSVDIPFVLGKLISLRQFTQGQTLPTSYIDVLINFLTSLNDQKDLSDLVTCLIDNLVCDEPLNESQIDGLFSWFFFRSSQSERAASYLVQWMILAVDNKMMEKVYIQENFYFYLVQSLERESSLVIPTSILLKKLTNKKLCKAFFVKKAVKFYEELNDKKNKSFMADYIRELFLYNPTNVKCPRLVAKPSKPLEPPEALKSNFELMTGNSRGLSTSELADMEGEEPSTSPVEMFKGLPAITYNSCTGIRLFDIKNLDDMISNWGRIVPPTIALSALANDVGLHFIRYAPPCWRSKFITELETVLALIVENKKRCDIDPEVVLSRVAALQAAEQEGIPCVSKFFSDFLYVWDSMRYRGPVVAMIPWLRFNTHEEMKLVMKNLFDVFIFAEKSFQLEVIKAFGNLYSNMVLIHLRNSQSSDFVPLYGWQAWLKEDPTTFLECYVTYVDLYFKGLSMMGPLGSAIDLEAILFFQLVSQIQVESGLGSWSVLSPVVFLSALFSSSLPVIDQLCSIIIWYVNAVIPKLKSDNQLHNYTNQLESLKLYIKEVVSFLWNEEKSWTFEGSTLMGSLIDKELIAQLKSTSLLPDQSDGRQFTIDKHPAFSTIFNEMKRALSKQNPFTREECVEVLKKLAPHCSQFVKHTESLVASINETNVNPSH